jgi:hypothetical protein
VKPLHRVRFAVVQNNLGDGHTRANVTRSGWS